MLRKKCKRFIIELFILNVGLISWIIGALIALIVMLIHLLDIIADSLLNILRVKD